MNRFNSETINRAPDGFVEPGFYFWLGSDAEVSEAGEIEESPDFDLGNVDEPELDFGSEDYDGQ